MIAHPARRTSRGPSVAFIAAVAGIAIAASAWAQQPRPVTFTNDQADQGRTAYLGACVDCHGANLDDGEFGGAPLKGNHFAQKWGQDTADILYLYMSTAMPPERPGQLTPRAYAAIMAFILRGNGYQPGGGELPSDPDALAKLTLVK
jgi:mono/diheme cytochrome c family protein